MSEPSFFERWERVIKGQSQATRVAMTREDFETGIDLIVKAEREACAKIADDDEGHFTWSGTDEGVKIRQQVAREIAAAIRARQ